MLMPYIAFTLNSVLGSRSTLVTCGFRYNYRPMPCPLRAKEVHLPLYHSRGGLPSPTVMYAQGPTLPFDPESYLFLNP